MSRVMGMRVTRPCFVIVTNKEAMAVKYENNRLLVEDIVELKDTLVSVTWCQKDKIIELTTNLMNWKILNGKMKDYDQKKFELILSGMTI